MPGLVRWVGAFKAYLLEEISWSERFRGFATRRFHNLAGLRRTTANYAKTPG
ncbi:hypothetical protein [Glutamicibacter protophormiae]|uniref:hypothetical protein n=1 Tax=Glutamicibacter protophormiae TaxID=37930 RepID=UPI003BAFBFF8